MKRVQIISVGDELLLGETVNTNAAFLARRLTAIGLEVTRVITVGDVPQQLHTAFSEAAQACDIVIATGGLGPTHDDITKQVAADFFGSRLVLDRKILAELEHRFKERGIEMAKVNKGQALVPEHASALNNPVGTAPGLFIEREGKQFFILPGVPSEMQAICEESVLPMLRASGQTILLKTIRTTGIPESTLFERLGKISELERFASVAFLPKSTGVDIRLTVRGSDANKCWEDLALAAALVQSRAQEFIYSEDERGLAEVVAAQLIRHNKTIAVAESCTGGLLANTLTNISGSSKYFERGVVAYSNQAKTELLQVPEALLIATGAVSEETAIAMAQGVRMIAHTDYGLATTGISGPTGGTEEKPVGLVYVALASSEHVTSRRFVFKSDRAGHKERTVQAALDLLRLALAASG